MPEQANETLWIMPQRGKVKPVPSGACGVAIVPWREVGSFVRWRIAYVGLKEGRRLRFIASASAGDFSENPPRAKTEGYATFIANSVKLPYLGVRRTDAPIEDPELQNKMAAAIITQAAVFGEVSK